MIYKEQFKIGLKDVCCKNQISNIALLEYLEDIAAYHSDSIGYGINSEKETNLNWLLLDWKLEVLKRPIYGQELNISTWSRKIEKFYAYRDFEVYDEKNNLCAIATSKWLLVDTKAEKISKVDSIMAGKYQSETSKAVFENEKLEKLKLPEEYYSEFVYKTQRRDIDLIGHMHNLYYLSLAYEALPNEEYMKRPFNNIRIQYKKEIKLNEIVKCKFSKREDKNVVVIVSEDEKLLHAIIEIN